MCTCFFQSAVCTWNLDRRSVEPNKPDTIVEVPVIIMYMYMSIHVFAFCILLIYMYILCICDKMISSCRIDNNSCLQHCVVRHNYTCTCTVYVIKINDKIL